MIKNFIFDFGRVLVDYDFDIFIDRLFDDKRELEEFRSVILSFELMNRVDKEEIPFKDIIAELQQQNPQWRSQLQYFYDNYFDIVTGEVPGMKELLTRLKREGYKLYGLTNWCSKVHEVIAYFDIFELLDGRIISSEEHMIKPDLEIYQCLCNKFGLKPEECLFADDKIANIEGAREAGLNAILFRDAEQFEREMRNYV